MIVDCDLAILGALRHRFDEYEQQIRSEFDFVSDADFVTGRLRAIAPFVARRAVFRTPRLRALIEARAQENLARSIARLQAQQSSSVGRAGG